MSNGDINIPIDLEDGLSKEAFLANVALLLSLGIPAFDAKFIAIEHRRKFLPATHKNRRKKIFQRFRTIVVDEDEGVMTPIV